MYLEICEVEVGEFLSSRFLSVGGWVGGTSGGCDCVSRSWVCCGGLAVSGMSLSADSFVEREFWRCAGWLG